MSNLERIKARIFRSKLQRKQKKEESNSSYDNFDKVFTYQHYYEALKKCLKGVSWKLSVQLYKRHCVELIHDTMESVHKGILPKLKNALPIILFERGKRRIITPIRIEDRMTQRVLCDYALVPVISKKLIYDNGASMKDKGVDFTRKRVDLHLKEAIKEYGSEFYILTFDFKSFFDSIPHKVCLDILKECFTDKRIIGITMAIIKSYQLQQAEKIKDPVLKRETIEKIKHNESRGICLGSQVSQIMALVVPNKLDHYIKDTMNVHHYVRYMDDGFIISDNKEYLKNLYIGMQIIAETLGLTFNTKKTKIVKSTKGFVFLKIRYKVKDGKLVKTIVKDGTTRMRRKLKKYTVLVQEGRMELDDVFNSIQSWVGHSKYASSHHIRKRMLHLYDKLFGGYRMTKYWRNKGGATQYALLQANKRKSFCWCWNVP